MILNFQRTSLALLLCIAGLTSQAGAQIHAHGSAWVHRDADQSTFLHADGDSLCWVDFPQRCYGGMMSPESLYCTFHTVPAESLPDSCYFAFDCDIQDPDGGSMMSGHMMQDGFFRTDLQCVFHYDPDVVASLGIDPNDLVLVVRTSGDLEVVSQATHGAGESAFHLSTSRIASWYGIAEKSAIPLSAETATWSRVKSLYRR